MIVIMANVSVAEAARQLGVGVSRIHQRIADGSLHAERIGSQWVVDELSLLRIAERRDPGRPLSPRSAWALIALSSGEQGVLKALAPVERRRAHDRLRRLFGCVADRSAGEEQVKEVAASLRSLLRNRAERRILHVASADAEDLRADSRWQVLMSAAASGIGANDVEGYVDDAAAAALIGAYLLSPSGAGVSVVMHVLPDGYRALPDSKLQVAADLVEHRGPREESRAVELLRELAEEWKEIRS